MADKSVIITGGGKGRRMGSEIPKQFLVLAGKPILMHTIEKFHAYDPTIEIILVLPEDQIDYWKDLCKSYDFQINHKCIAGGEERFHSVKNGLSIATGKLIGVHDAVRPLVAPEVIKACYEKAAEVGAVIPVTGLKQSLRMSEEEDTVAVDRSMYKLVQTPQCFQAEIIRKAYEQEFSKRYTDDASVAETSGIKIYTVQGNEENIKITTPMDFKVTEFLLTHE